MRIVDPAMLGMFRLAHRCDFCGRATPHGCDPAHLFSRGAGRLDVRINLMSLCRGMFEGHYASCHEDQHAGLLTQADLLAKKAAILGCQQGDIRDAVQWLRRLDKDASPRQIGHMLREIGPTARKLAREALEERP